MARRLHVIVLVGCAGRDKTSFRPPARWCYAFCPSALDGRSLLRLQRTASRGFAASWLFSPRRQALILLEHCTAFLALPNVRAKRATTAGRQGPDGENVPCTTGRALAACRWRSA